MPTYPRRFQLARKKKKKIGTTIFEVNFGKKLVKCTSWQKALNLQNKRSRVSYFENVSFVRDVMSNVNVTYGYN